MLNFPDLWKRATTYPEFLAGSGIHRGLWEGLYRLARIPEWATGMTAGQAIHLLVLLEDWCGDASNVVPLLARWADQSASVQLRVLKRDENPEVMSRYLTNGSRSIPIVIVLDDAFKELGHWGPRPRALQQWVLEHRGSIPKADLYPQIRKWYARDRGETTLRELLELLPLPYLPISQPRTASRCSW